MTEAQKPLEILVIDDDAPLRDLFKEVVEASGANATAAKDGLDGLAKYILAMSEEKQYDAVLTDLSMPKVDGGMVTQVVKVLNPNTQVVVITGKEPTTEYALLSENLKQNKPDGILQKPVPPEDLMHVVKQIGVVIEKRKIQPYYQTNPSLYLRTA